MLLPIRRVSHIRRHHDTNNDDIAYPHISNEFSIPSQAELLLLLLLLHRMRERDYAGHTEDEPHDAAHEVKYAGDEVAGEAEDGLDGGENGGEDAGEDFEEGGDEVGDAGC